MQKTAALVSLLLLGPVFFLTGLAQQNCSNPLVVELCSGTTLTNQTNAGMLDDNPASCNIAGEDVLYKLHATGTTTRLYIAVRNASGGYRLSLQNSCGASCSTFLGNAGSGTFTYYVLPASYYYIWMDAATTITYDISFGGDTAVSTVVIPNTQGLWQTDPSCEPQPFRVEKPFFRVTYNDSIQVHPMTLAPLFQSGRMCFTVYMKNTTGVEGLKKVDFQFSSGGFSAITPVTTTLPGFYNAGNWQYSQTSVAKVFTFSDQAVTGKGDFTGTPNNCLAYSFCFNLTPLTNDPVLTNIYITLTSDGFGIGSTTTTRLGCCPVPVANCLGSASSTQSGRVHAVFFGISDPPLPVQLLYFKAEPSNQEMRLSWSTATESDNDYFTLEKSKDLARWDLVDRISGTGNSSMPVEYLYIDKHPFDGLSYYRLTQTDFDGTTRLAGTCAARLYNMFLQAYPIPARDILFIYGAKEVQSVLLLSTMGRTVPLSFSDPGESLKLDVHALPEGVYLLRILSNNKEFNQRILVSR